MYGVPASPDLELPAESVLLKAAYRTSGLTVADLASATGMSTGAVTIALDGFRYRSGEPRRAVPPDHAVVRLALALHITPADVRAAGRDRAADLMTEALGEHELPADAPASLAQRVLAAFSTEELRAELARRERLQEQENAAEHEAWRQEGIDDAAAELRMDWGQP